jgi:hypothetical protein
MAGLDDIAKKHALELDKKQLASLSQLFSKSLHYIADYIEAICQILPSWQPTSILVNSLGNTFRRCLCIAGRRSGFKIVGFTHGNDIGIFNTSICAYIEPSMVDTWVVPTENSIELFSLSAQKFLQPYGKNVQFVANVSASYAQIKERIRATLLPRSIAKVMLIEYPLTESYFPSSDAQFLFFQLDLNLRIATLLRKNGVITTLKKHPDRLLESEGVYERYYDELLITAFEKVYDQADAYIFPSIATTTFGFALLTNKPIIIFESSLEDVWEPASELLRKRCRVVPSWIAEDGRLMFDEQALIAALHEPVEEPNDELIERYMLS